MTTMQLQKEIVERLQDLSKETLQEVFDYVQFIRFKKNKADNIDATLTLLDANEAQHIVKEFANYKTLYPRE